MEFSSFSGTSGLLPAAAAEGSVYQEPPRASGGNLSDPSANQREGRHQHIKVNGQIKVLVERDLFTCRRPSICVGSIKFI